MILDEGRSELQLGVLELRLALFDLGLRAADLIGARQALEERNSQRDAHGSRRAVGRLEALIRIPVSVVVGREVDRRQALGSRDADLGLSSADLRPGRQDRRVPRAGHLQPAIEVRHGLLGLGRRILDHVGLCTGRQPACVREDRQRLVKIADRALFGEPGLRERGLRLQGVAHRRCALGLAPQGSVQRLLGVASRVRARTNGCTAGDCVEVGLDDG